MHVLLTFLLTWAPLLFLASILIPQTWLNERSSLTRSTAETLGWAAFVSTSVAFILWLTSGQESLTSTPTDAEIIGVRLDPLSLAMTSLVSFLGAIVLQFSKNYLAGDHRQGYFCKWMVVTLGAVLSLCLSPGLVQFWFSWVVCSLGLHQLLVYFPDRLGTLLSARKKFVVSRAGDLCLIIAFIGIYLAFDTQGFSELFYIASVDPSIIANNAWIGWLIVFGAALKSAQFPFHTWLPDTMGTPTPVSALMHAGIINAGGYLVIRMSPLLTHAPSALYCLAIIGAITLTGASLVMLTQTSVKRALAYSTIAQMGFMLLQCGLGAFSLAALHLAAHSLYKAHAFLSSGSTVETLKRLESNPISPVPPKVLFGLTCLSFGMVALFFAAFWGVEWEAKPGLLVLGAVLALALTQFLIAKRQQEPTSRGLVKSIVSSSGLVILYLGLAKLSLTYFEGVLPLKQTTGAVFQSILAVLLGTLFLASMFLSQNATGLTSKPLFRSFYVHVLNGFYLNTIANRLARSIGLVPAGR